MVPMERLGRISYMFKGTHWMRQLNFGFPTEIISVSSDTDCVDQGPPKKAWFNIVHSIFTLSLTHTRTKWDPSIVINFVLFRWKLPKNFISVMWLKRNDIQNFSFWISVNLGQNDQNARFRPIFTKFEYWPKWIFRILKRKKKQKLVKWKKKNT